MRMIALIGVCHGSISICCLVVYRRQGGIEFLQLWRVVVWSIVPAGQTSKVGIDERVEGIEVEREVRTVRLGHRTPRLHGTIVLSCFVPVTAIFAGLGAIICIQHGGGEVRIGLGGSISSTVTLTGEEIDVSSLGGCHLRIGEQVAIVDVLVVAQFDGAGADVGFFKLVLGRCIHLIIFRCRDGVAFIDMVFDTTYRIGHLVGSDVGTSHGSLIIGIFMSTISNSRVLGVDIARDDVAHSIVALTIDTAGGRGVGGCADILTV